MAEETVDFSITTPKRKPKTIIFELEGEIYHFTPPKRAGMVFGVIDRSEDTWGVAALKSQYDWLDEGLAEGEGKRLEDLLRDPNSNFDTEDMEGLFQRIMKKVNGENPTG